MKEHVPFVDLLEASGYYTGFTGKGVDPFQYARNDQDTLWRKGNAAGHPFNKHKYEKNTSSDLRTAKGIGLTNYYENFRSFMQQRKDGQPFYFWYGATEPHRVYEKGSWKRNGKKTRSGRCPRLSSRFGRSERRYAGLCRRNRMG